jgi:hypothetical protein
MNDAIQTLQYGDITVRKISASEYEISRPEFTIDLYVKLCAIRTSLKAQGFRCIAQDRFEPNGRIVTRFVRHDWTTNRPRGQSATIGSDVHKVSDAGDARRMLACPGQAVDV